jgi:glycosyltransferase involved in cell wall biosynthesis
MEKKKILILIPHFLPGNKLGGPVASIANLIDNLADVYDFKVLTMDRDLGDSTPYPNIPTNYWIEKDKYQICYIPKNIFLSINLIKQINKTKSDILYLNSFFGFYFSIFIAIFSKLGLIKVKNIIIAPRGEFIENCLEISKLKKRIYMTFAFSLKIYKNYIWHASTENEKIEIRKITEAPESSIRVALNMTKIDSDYDDNVLFQNQTRKDGYLKIIFLSRISKEKNLDFALDVLQKIKSNVIYDIYGPLENKDLWNTCLEKIKKMPPNITINYCNVVNREDVKRTFAKYDLFFFPTVGENFGHVMVESLLVGTPILISDKTPWRNLYADGLGWDISLANPHQFVEAIENMAKSKVTLNSRRNIAEIFRKRLTNPDIRTSNIELFKLEINKV